MQKYVGREKAAALSRLLELQLSVQTISLRTYLMYNKSGACSPPHLRGRATPSLNILVIRAGCAEADCDPLDLGTSANPVPQLWEQQHLFTPQAEGED